MTNMSTTLLVLGIVIIFPIFFIALWCGITVLISWIGGWSAVAKVYAATGKPDAGQTFYRVTGMFGVSSYRFTLKVIVTSQGLYLETSPIFRLAHPPLFIPFEVMKNVSSMTLLRWTYIAFNVEEPPLARVRLPAQIFFGTPIMDAANIRNAAL